MNCCQDEVVKVMFLGLSFCHNITQDEICTHILYLSHLLLIMHGLNYSSVT